MRLAFLTAIFALCYGAQPVAAQQASGPSSNEASQDRIALSTRPDDAPAARPMRLACAPLAGQVFDPNGEPLVGATLLVKGTHQVYVTDSDGKFQLSDAIYQGQVVSVGAAGYDTRDYTLEECTLPRLVLEQLPTAHIKQKGKRAGQVTRLNNRNTNLK